VSEPERLTTDILVHRMIDTITFAARDATGCDRAYWAMTREWKSVVATERTDEEKKADCLAILRDHIDNIARGRVGQTNAPLRFYADMLVLGRQLLPRRCGDPLGRLAILPAYHAVACWIGAPPPPG
jgi:hypothetical protein